MLQRRVDLRNANGRRLRAECRRDGVESPWTTTASFGDGVTLGPHFARVVEWNVFTRDAILHAVDDLLPPEEVMSADELMNHLGNLTRFSTIVRLAGFQTLEDVGVDGEEDGGYVMDGGGGGGDYLFTGGNGVGRGYVSGVFGADGDVDGYLVYSDDANVKNGATMKRNVQRFPAPTTTSSTTAPVTIFAPTDDAFDAMDAETRARFTSGDAVEMRRLVQFHVAKGKVTLSELAGEVKVKSHALWWGRR